MTTHIFKDKDEVNLLDQGKIRESGRGQIFVLLAVAIPVLLMFIGLSIDFGLAYITKTTLSKSVDAAALAAMRNYNEGKTTATTIAQNVFNVNYNSLAGLGTTTGAIVTFSVDSNNNTLCTVSATATLPMYFLGVLGSNFRNVNITQSATAMRNPMIMALVLDVSTSMEHNGGEAALAPAVEDFIADFDSDNTDTTDYVSVVTFGTSGYVNQAMTQPLKDPVDNAVSAISWAGTNFTNSQSGLLLGQTQIANQFAKVPAGQNVLKVLVFFTDGWPNIIQDTLTCPATKTSGVTTANLMYCGCDVGDINLGLCRNTPCVINSAEPVCFFNPASCGANNTCSQPSTGCGSNTADLPTIFPDQYTGTNESLTGGVTYCGGSSSQYSDAMYRATQVSTAATTGLLAQNVYVYSIGMGDAITGQPTAETFLETVANCSSTACPAASPVFNADLPQGEAVFASTSAELDSVFQIIASKILLRLSK
jgi:Flp pilus assembly protein TadG